MIEFLNSKTGIMTTALLWTAVAAIWSGLTIVRAVEHTGARLLVLTALAATMSIVACVLNWIRWAGVEHKEDETE